MSNGEEVVQVIESTGVEVFEAQERAAIDIQISTAKRFPRREQPQIVNSAIKIVCSDKETAMSCRYAKPVAGKNVTGPSVHLARILVQQYGNIRVQQRIKQISDRTVVAEAVAFDLETNYAVAVEARRSIVDRMGKRYSESMIETTAMACLAVAERNAILKIIPKGIIDQVYDTAFNFVNGDLSDKQQLLIAQKKAFDFFSGKYDANEDDILKVLGLRSTGQITKEHIADLRGYMQALKDGELTAIELFGRKKGLHDEPAPDAFSQEKHEKIKDIESKRSLKRMPESNNITEDIPEEDKKDKLF